MELLGKRLVLWRDSSNEWHCFLDRCPHRLAPLSGKSTNVILIYVSCRGNAGDVAGCCGMVEVCLKDQTIVGLVPLTRTVEGMYVVRMPVMERG
jgi:hypothetical protein